MKYVERCWELPNGEAGQLSSSCSILDDQHLKKGYQETVGELSNVALKSF